MVAEANDSYVDEISEQTASFTLAHEWQTTDYVD